MLFTIARDSLLEGLSKTVSITDKRSPLPILSHVLIEVVESQLTLSATDLSVGLRMVCDCEVRLPGTIAVPGRKFFEIVKELTPGSISVELTESGRIKIAYGKGVFELAAMDAADYPALSAFEAVETAAINSETLLSMIDKTVFAASSDESRIMLSGVLFEKEEDRINVVATDSHRLGFVSGELGISVPARVVVPRRGLTELKRMLEGQKLDVFLGFEEKNMVVKTERFLMTIRLIDGEYPDYRRVIPQPGGLKFKVNRNEMFHAVRRVGLLTSDRNKGINIDISPGTMELTAVHPDLGTARDSVDVEYEGEAFSMVINYAYLMDSFNAVDSESLTMEFHEEERPVMVNPYPPADYFNMIMPMRKDAV